MYARWRARAYIFRSDNFQKRVARALDPTLRARCTVHWMCTKLVLGVVVEEVVTRWQVRCIRCCVRTRRNEVAQCPVLRAPPQGGSCRRALLNVARVSSVSPEGALSHVVAGLVVVDEGLEGDVVALGETAQQGLSAEATVMSPHSQSELGHATAT